MKKIFITIILLVSMSSVAWGARLNKVVLDAGHGGYDYGIRTDEFREKDLTVSIVRDLKAVLDNSYHKKVFLSRPVDAYTSIRERRAAANARTPDIFLSVHVSSGANFAVYVTWYQRRDADLTLQDYYALPSRQRRYLHESDSFARVMEGALKDSFPDREVYHREMSLELLGSIGAPAIIVEVPSVGFDYDEDMAVLIDALGRGIYNYEQQR